MEGTRKCSQSSEMVTPILQLQGASSSFPENRASRDRLLKSMDIFISNIIHLSASEPQNIEHLMLSYELQSAPIHMGPTP